MSITTILAILTTLATIFVVIAMTRKWWWAPIAGLLHQGLWAAFALQLDDGWPIMGAVVVYAVVYALAIPKWYRERPCRSCS